MKIEDLFGFYPLLVGAKSWGVPCMKLRITFYLRDFPCVLKNCKFGSAS